jgi:hypothetical protein
MSLRRTGDDQQIALGALERSCFFGPNQPRRTQSRGNRPRNPLGVAECRVILFQDENDMLLCYATS